jgi:hypothetical protein
MGSAGALRIEHALVVALIVACFATPGSRRFARLFMPMALCGVLYDVQKILPPLGTTVHVAGPYLAERLLFGGGATPNELLARHPSVWLDVVCAVPYLTYILESLALFAFLYARDVERAWRFGWAFFAVNVAGMVTIALFPCAPPWYVAEHGLGPAILGTRGHPAAALRFDALVGAPVFATLYTRESDVFGAIPSLHAAFPVLVALTLRPRSAMRLAAWAYAGCMLFAAVYLQHHYVIDVMAGVAYAIAGHVTTHIVTNRRSPSHRVSH